MAPTLFAFLLSLSLCRGADDIVKEVPTEESVDVTGNMLVLDEMFTASHSFSSNISMSVNPGCTYNNCTLPNGAGVCVANTTITDIPAQDSEQHWLWSVIGRPTLQAAITEAKDVISINWNGLFGFTDMAESITYTQKPHYTAAIMMTNLIEYNDTRDKGVMDDTDSRGAILYPLINFSWRRNILENTDEHVAVQFIGENYTTWLNENVNLTGKINLTISGYATDGYGLWLPHLSHSQHTSQVDLQLDHLNSTSGFKHSRFGIELVLVSETGRNSSLVRQTSTTLDDEHTPGIFKTEELVLPGWNETLQSYLQWRPVVYTTPARDLSESTGVYVNRSKPVEDAVRTLDKTLLYALYGKQLDNYLVRGVNVTFGSPEDGFYKKTHFQAWTFTFGVGDPIRNGLSPVIILVITVMIGILAIVFVTSSFVCAYKKWKQRRNATPGSYGQM